MVVASKTVGGFAPAILHGVVLSAFIHATRDQRVYTSRAVFSRKFSFCAGLVLFQDPTVGGRIADLIVLSSRVEVLSSPKGQRFRVATDRVGGRSLC